MEEPALSPFEDSAEKLVENNFQLIMARKLKAIWADVLQESIPPDLQALLSRLEAAQEPDPDAKPRSG